MLATPLPVPLSEILSYIQSAGGAMAPVFFILYLVERSERVDAQKELRQVAEKSVIAMTEMKALIAQLTLVFRGGNGGNR